MPQNTLTDKPNVDLVIKVHDLIYQGDAAFIVTVQCSQLDDILKTVSVQRYSGVGVDFLLTAVRDTVAAWLYQDVRETKRAADSTARAARRHAEAHEGV